MDSHKLAHLGAALQRLNTNDSSASDSVFSRQGSSTSVATTIHSPRVLEKSLSFTKINEEGDAEEANSNLKSQHVNSLSLESLHLALNNLATATTTHQGQPKSTNKLTTTPTNERAVDSKWCIILVGLPATGKSSICKNLIKYTTTRFQNQLRHSEFKIDSFNAGHFRRKLSNFKDQTSDYFSVTNSEAKQQREVFAHIALDHLLNSLLGNQINIGIFDATNTSRARRDYIFQTIKEKEIKTGIKINTAILHVKCTDHKLWRYNVDGKTMGPDYSTMNYEKAINDFIKRADQYKEAFEDITPEELHKHQGSVYIEIDNAGKDYIVDTNGYGDADHDLIFAELEKFFKSYYHDYGLPYEENVNKFWEGQTVNY